jgi:predicted nucleic acid-binding protein
VSALLPLEVSNWSCHDEALDSDAARAFAKIGAARRALGRPISRADAQIAALAQVRGAKLATRNVDDFAGCGIEVVDPWNR